VGPQFALSDTPLRAAPPAPGLGEHTSEVLAEFGFDDAEIELLRTSEVT
jgi:crotonobetainyl-CoA:carnitine CoA-transferase CaiB-like acyl-CoA transferase